MGCCCCPSSCSGCTTTSSAACSWSTSRSGSGAAGRADATSSTSGVARPAGLASQPGLLALHGPVPAVPTEPPLLGSGRPLRQRQRDVLESRGRYASFVTVLTALAVLSISSVLVLQFETHAPDATITRGGEAVWWAVVTITTVGYGDHYLVTFLGRATAMFVMFSGVGIIGALTSILASVLVTPRNRRATTQPDPAAPASHERPSDTELAQLRLRIEDMHRTLRELVAAAEPKTPLGPARTAPHRRATDVTSPAGTPRPASGAGPRQRAAAACSMAGAVTRSVSWRRSPARPLPARSRTRWRHPRGSWRPAARQASRRRPPAGP